MNANIRQGLALICAAVPLVFVGLIGRNASLNEDPFSDQSPLIGVAQFCGMLGVIVAFIALAMIAVGLLRDDTSD